MTLRTHKTSQDCFVFSWEKNKLIHNREPWNIKKIFRTSFNMNFLRNKVLSPSITKPLKLITSRTVFTRSYHYYGHPDNIMYARFVCMLGLMIASTPVLLFNKRMLPSSEKNQRHGNLYSYHDHQYFHWSFHQEHFSVPWWVWVAAYFEILSSSINFDFLYPHLNS